MASYRSLNRIRPCVTNYVDSIVTLSTFFLNDFNILIDGACKVILVQTRKARGKVELELHAFLTSATAEGLRSALRSRRFISGETAVDVHCLKIGWAPEPK